MFRNEKDALKYYLEILQSSEKTSGMDEGEKDERIAIDLRGVFQSLNLSQEELDILFLTVVRKLDYWKAAMALSDKHGRAFTAEEVFVSKSSLVYRVKRELFNFGLLMFLK